MTGDKDMRSLIVIAAIAGLILSGCGEKKNPFSEDGIKNRRTMERLLNAGLDPNTYNQTTFNQDSLLYFAVRCRSADVVRLLLSHGANVDQPSKAFHKTPLFQAAYQGDTEIVGILVKAGCNVNHLDSSGNNALREAILGKHSDVVGLLVEAGADPMLKNKDGETMIDIAGKHGDAKTMEVLRQHSQ